MTATKDDLWFPKLLVSAGAPVFVASQRSHTPADARAEFRFPLNWPDSPEGISGMSEWVEGDAVCAVTGIAFDVVDVDPRHGGIVDAERAALREHEVEVLAEVRTPGMGAHFYIPVTGRAKSSNASGIDFQARGACVFVPPTLRPKHDGRGYEVVHTKGFNND